MSFRLARTKHRAALPSGDPADEKIASLVALAYELLDAHADTAQLDADDASEAEWSSHLVYLMDLQRVGRETLAQAVAAPTVDP
jgi:hypothetical protein